MEYVIEFDSRTPLVGPFHTEQEAEATAAEIAERRSIANWRIRPMQVPGLARLS
jgi:hypothetical protein